MEYLNWLDYMGIISFVIPLLAYVYNQFSAVLMSIEEVKRRQSKTHERVADISVILNDISKNHADILKLLYTNQQEISSNFKDQEIMIINSLLNSRHGLNTHSRRSTNNTTKP